MISYILDWLGVQGSDITVYRFAVMPIVVACFTIPFGALWSMLAHLFGVVFRGRKQ